MANLMTDSYDYTDLVKSYGNFQTPALKVKIGGSDLDASVAASISSLSVILELDAASSANFTIENVYDLEKSELKSEVRSVLTLGDTISIEMGYGSSLTTVFWGFISEVDYAFNTGVSVRVAALDAVDLMRKNVKKNFTYEEKKYSDVVSTVLKTYKKLVKKQEIATTSEEFTEIKQNCSDYEFLTEDLSNGSNYEFFILGDTAYYRKIGTATKSIMTLEWGTSLLSFNATVKYHNEYVCMYSMNGTELITSKKMVKTDDQVKTVITPVPTTEVQNAEVLSQKEADNKVACEVDRILKSARSGSGSCIGLPEIIPGRYIKIDKLEDSINKNYYLTRVSHNYSDDGFTTDFDIGGWSD